MEKLLEILSSFQDEVWFYDFRVDEEEYSNLFYEEFNVELIVKGSFTISDLMSVVTELIQNGYNIESFFETEERKIKDTYLVRFGVWRR